jgi:hypothetical protein
MNLHEVSFYYQYIVGGIVFAICMILALASGELSLRTSEGRRYFAILVGGFALYIGVHGLSVFVWPYR